MLNFSVHSLMNVWSMSNQSILKNGLEYQKCLKIENCSNNKIRNSRVIVLKKSYYHSDTIHLWNCIFSSNWFNFQCTNVLIELLLLWFLKCLQYIMLLPIQSSYSYFMNKNKTLTNILFFFVKRCILEYLSNMQFFFQFENIKYLVI